MLDEFFEFGDTEWVPIVWKQASLFINKIAYHR